MNRSTKSAAILLAIVLHASAFQPLGAQGLGSRFDAAMQTQAAPSLANETDDVDVDVERFAAASPNSVGQDSSITPAPQNAFGDVQQPAIETHNVLDALRAGGVMMIPIVACSVLLLMFVFERAINLRRGKVIPKHFVKRFFQQLEEGELKPETAIELCEENHSPVAEVFAAAVKKWERPAVEVEQAVLDTGERVANQLRSYLRLFSGISNVSPLMGLLGTVLGMIEAFNSIATADAMGRPEVLAAGISQALLTTAGGLLVAIPAFVAYLYFSSRVDRLIIDIDAYGQELVNVIASDGWNGKAKRKARTKAA